MNKAELVDYVSEQTGMYKKDAKIAVDAVLDGIERGMKKDGKVTLVGFGNFIVRQRKARTGRNPQNGRPVRVPPKQVPSFKPSEKLKESIE